MVTTPFGILGFLVLVLDVIAIINVIGGRSPFERKALWTFVILILPVLGMILYFLIGRSRQDMSVTL
jgi:hypothetical protein